MNRREFIQQSTAAGGGALVSGKRKYTDKYGRKTNLPDTKGGTCIKCRKEVDHYESHYQNKDHSEIVLHMKCGGKKARVSGHYYFRFDG